MLLASDATPGNMAWWPDGGSVVYMSWGDDYRTDDEGDITGTKLLWRLDLGTLGKHLLAEESGESVMSGATVSPDGRHLAYLDGRHWKVLDLATGAAREVIASFGAREADWSPDGKWLAFARFAGNDAEGRRTPDLPGLWRWPVGGGDSVKIVPYPDDLQSSNGARMWPPHWSPDGRWIAFMWWLREEREGGRCSAHRNEVWLVRPDGSELHHVVSMRHAALPGYRPLLGRQCWSPDGRRLVLAWVEPRGEPKLNEQASGQRRVEIEAMPAGVQVLDIETGRFTTLVAPDAFPGADWSGPWPAWSPDGRHVAFVVSGGWAGPHRGQRDIHVVSVASGETLPVVSGGGVTGTPLWSPDSSSLLYLRKAAREAGAEGPPRSELWMVKMGAQGSAAG